MSKHFLAVVAVLMLLLSGCGTNAFAPPSGVIITVKAASIELKWNPVDSVSGYNVYRSSETGPLSTKTRIASGLSQPFYLDSYATPGVTYYYQITAFNSTGDSTASPELSATIKAAPASDVLMGGGVQGSPLHLSYSVSIFAGTTKPGSTDGQGKSAAFGYPAGITTDGRNLFIADTLNNAIRKVIISTGEVTTLAGGPASGTSDGVGSDARFYYPYGITTDGTSLFVSEFGNHMVRRIEITSGTVTTLAGAPTPGSSNGIGAAASFKNPCRPVFWT